MLPFFYRVLDVSTFRRKSTDPEVELKNFLVKIEMLSYVGWSTYKSDVRILEKRDRERERQRERNFYETRTQINGIQKRHVKGIQFLLFSRLLVILTLTLYYTFRQEVITSPYKTEKKTQAYKDYRWYQ